MEPCFDGYAYITEECLGAFRMGRPIVPARLAVQIMRHPEFPMHYPYHHYLVPVSYTHLDVYKRQDPVYTYETNVMRTASKMLTVPMTLVS